MASNQPDYRPTEAGLPDASEYDPEANLEVAAELGEPDFEAPQYGLHTRPLTIGGEQTGRRAVLRNGEFIAYVSDRYQPLPNERVVEVANDVAEQLGLQPFHDWERPSGDGWFFELDDHIFQDRERRRVHALYASESGTVGGDDMEFGVAIHNSIDTSLAFKVAVFTYRHACANMVNIGVGNARDRMAQNVEEERGVEFKSERIHTSGFDISKDALQARIKSTLFFVDAVQDAYENWVGRELTWREVENLIERHPDSDLPAWIQEVREDFVTVAENEDVEGTEANLTPDKKAELVQARRPTAATTWKTYNDITENIWSSDNQDTTKLNKFSKLHRTFDPLATVGDD
jgi:hypothetical protein